jgi:uncharacterized repeat protein (TIGR03833 family)
LHGVVNAIKNGRGQKMDGTKRCNIKIGATVLVVQKQDQRSGKLTEGVVQRILTNSPDHHHGIKVMLEGGIVGRVKEIKN